MTPKLAPPLNGNGIEFAGTGISKLERNLFEIIDSTLNGNNIFIERVERNCGSDGFLLTLLFPGEFHKAVSLSNRTLLSILNPERLDKITHDLTLLFVNVEGGS